MSYNGYMALYVIGDLHLHFQAELKNHTQLSDPLWRDHESKLRKNCKALIKEEDTLVLLGDHSWGRDLEECKLDFDYIKRLPGRKILTRGNHDMFWDAKKTQKLNDIFNPQLTFLQEGYETYGDYALVASKGFTFEGPFYLDRKGRIIGWDKEKEEQAKKLVDREAKRLISSFEKAKADGQKKFIMFIHYPPTNVMQKGSIFTEIAERYDVEQVIYAHCHGKRRFDDSIKGEYRGRTYKLASGDYLNWVPLKILD